MTNGFPTQFMTNASNVPVLIAYVHNAEDQTAQLAAMRQHILGRVDGVVFHLPRALDIISSTTLVSNALNWMVLWYSHEDSFTRPLADTDDFHVKDRMFTLPSLLEILDNNLSRKLW